LAIRNDRLEMLGRYFRKVADFVKSNSRTSCTVPTRERPMAAPESKRGRSELLGTFDQAENLDRHSQQTDVGSHSKPSGDKTYTRSHLK
jgi:hypothetical protein